MISYDSKTVGTTRGWRPTRDAVPWLPEATRSDSGYFRWHGHRRRDDQWRAFAKPVVLIDNLPGWWVTPLIVDA